MQLNHGCGGVDIGTKSYLSCPFHGMDGEMRNFAWSGSLRE